MLCDLSAGNGSPPVRWQPITGNHAALLSNGRNVEEQQVWSININFIMSAKWQTFCHGLHEWKTLSRKIWTVGEAGSTGNGLGWQCGTGQPKCVPLEALRLDPALRIGPIKHCQVAHTLKCLSLSLIAVTMCLNSWYCKNMWIILFIHI